MDKAITLNIKTPVHLKDVFLIERLTEKDLERLAAKTTMTADRLAAFRSNVRFIDGSNILVTQPLEDIGVKGEGRFLIVRREASDRSEPRPMGIVPIDAVRHLEFVTKEERASMRARYEGTDPAKIDQLRTRIVYAQFDPASVQAGKPKPFQKMFPVDIQKDLREGQKREIIGIGNARFLLADEIVDARDLSETELANLSRKYNLRSNEDGDLVTSITLRSGDLIMSSFSAAEIAARIKRPLASAPAAPIGGQAPTALAKN
jgi:hypothetical protein